MLCVTGAEPTLAALRRRLQAHSDARLQELRLDLLAETFEPRALEGLPGERLLVTCRPVREGGGYSGPEPDRLALLESAVEHVRPVWVDVEADVPDEERARLTRAAHRCGARVLVSRHELRPGAAEGARAALERLVDLGGDAVKLAVAVEDAAELVPLRAAAVSCAVPAVVIGMGPAGLVSRALHDRFGSAWTFAAADGDATTAPGQLTVQSFAEWNLPLAPGAKLFALVGGPQVLESPGPLVYGRLFRERRIDACYLPVITERLEATLGLLVDLGLRGASITMPLKQRAASLVAELGSEARAAGAVNTITVAADGTLRGDLTDGEGAVAALERVCGSVRERQVAVLGTGATAAAIASALIATGAQVILLGRDRRRAEELAERLAVRAGGLEDLASIPFDVLVQATPVGADDAGATLVEDASVLRGKVVLDVVHGRKTRLLAETAKQGGRPVFGRSMWAEQGRRQLARWLGIEVEPDTLEVDR